MASFNNSFIGGAKCSACGESLNHAHKFCSRCGEATGAASFVAPSSFVSSAGLGRKRLNSFDSDEGSEVADCGQDDLLQELQENERLTDRITELERLKAELQESWLQRHQELESSIEELHHAEQEEAAEALYQASLEEERRASSNPASPSVPSPAAEPARKPMAAVLAEQVKEIVQSEHHLKDEEDFAHLVEERARLRKEFQAGEEELERRRTKVTEAEHQLELQQKALDEARIELEKERDAENAKVEMLRSEAARLRGGRGRCLTGNLAAELLDDGGSDEDGSAFRGFDGGGLAAELLDADSAEDDRLEERADDAEALHESTPFEEGDRQSAGELEDIERISPPTLQPPHSDGAACSEVNGQSTTEPLEDAECTSARESVESPQTQQPEHSNGTTCSNLDGHEHGVAEQVKAPEPAPLDGAVAAQPLPAREPDLERARALGLYDAVRRQCYQRALELADPPAQRRDACEEGGLQAPRPDVPDGAVARARALGLGDAVRGRCYQRAMERAEAAAQESPAPPLEARRVSFAPPSGITRLRLDTEAASAGDEDERADTERADTVRSTDLRRVSTYSLEDPYEALTTMAKYVQVRVSNAGEAPDDTEDLRELWEVFRACDANGDGSINMRELIKACRERPEVAAFFGLPSEIQQESESRRAVMEFFQGADDDNDREINWEELCRAHRARVRAGSRRPSQSSRSPRLRLASRGAQDDRRFSTCSLEARYEALSPKGGMLALEDGDQEAGAGSRLAAPEEDGAAPAARGAAVAEAEERLAHVRALLGEARASAARLREEVDEVERRRTEVRDSARLKEEQLRRELEVALGRLRERRTTQPEASWWSMFGASFCCSRAGGTPATPPPPPEAVALAGAAGDGAPAPAVALAGAADMGAPAPAGPGDAAVAADDDDVYS